MSTTAKISNKKKTIDRALLNDELLPQTLLQELNKLRIAHGAKSKLLLSLFEYLHDLIGLLADDLRPSGKINLGLYPDSNIRQKKYLTHVKRNYHLLTYKLIPYVTYTTMFTIIGVSLLADSWSLLPLWIFILFILSVLMINIRAAFFGNPLKYRLLYYQLPLFQLRTRLANGVQLQLKAHHRLVLIKRIRKKVKFKKNRLTKTSVKNKASLVLTLRLDLPRVRYTMTEDEIAYFFRPGIPFKGAQITKIKTKSTSKKHTVILQWPRVQANNGHSYFLFPPLDLNETIELITEGVLSRLTEKTMIETRHKLDEEKSDDLTLIKGIGEGIQDLLYQAQVRTFQQLAEMSPEALQDFLANHELSDTPLNETWQQQAKAFLKK